jgi:hypothetical protein
MTPPASRRAFARVPVRVARLDRVRVLRAYALVRDARYVVYLGANMELYEANGAGVYLSLAEEAELKALQAQLMDEYNREVPHDE